ncbi:MAG: peptidoglycan recognition protein family protein [Planctomycetota bacterium]|jgi:hypothetical protein|nr:peptidoglycan recognition protein family protein [Planctomycetota bacterium]
MAEGQEKLDQGEKDPAAGEVATLANFRRRLTLMNQMMRHRRRMTQRQTYVALGEWLLALVLVVLGFYYLWGLIFPAPVALGPVSFTLADFRAVARALPALPASPDWASASLSPRWRRIVVHHSASTSGNAEIFDRFHREERKWENGLGYHFVIGNGQGMGDGEVAVGNRWREQIDGAHVRGTAGGDNLNASSIGIALVGNFQDSLPTPRQLAALKGLVNYLRQAAGISLAEVIGHNEVSGRGTLCPGHNFYVDEFRLALANP